MIEPNAKRIKVMRIIARMNVGGPAIQITGLMKSLNGIEFEQRLYTGYCDVNESDYLEKVAAEVSVNRINGLGRSINLLSDFKALARLIQEIRSFKPDIIHTHTAKAGVLGRLASIISMHKSQRVHTYHGHLLYGYFGKTKTNLVIIIEKFLSRFTHVLLAVGTKVREELLQVGIGNETNFELMPPGLDIQKLPEKKIAKEKLEIQSDKLQALFVGRVTQVKRPDRFLELVREARHRGLEIDFLMAGDGNLLETCRSQIESEGLPVKLLGWQTDIELVLAASDIVILTSDNEGTPLSLIQAGMAGLPVLTTDVGSVLDVVISNVTGIVTTIDVIEMANNLEKLILDPNLRVELGINAMNFTKSNFSIDRLTKDHEVLYRKLIANQANF
jgi:glycosyltransferase involved in cell wall biosynthesis